MKIYTVKTEACGKKAVALEDMILTRQLPTAAGSRMLEGFMSLFDATAAQKLKENGYAISGKVQVGEFHFDIMGESAYSGACTDGESLRSASAEALKEGGIEAVVCLDVNGAPRRAAAQNGMTFIKPTYGCVSRFGTVPVACSGETVGVMAKDVSSCKEVLTAIAGYDCKDGTMHSDEKIQAALENAAMPRKLALAKSLLDLAGDEVKAQVSAAVESFKKAGVEVCEIDADILPLAKTAWNILMSAELCNNVSRYDGVKYGYRSPKYENIDELYTNSRTEAFGGLLKTAILFGSDTLSTENYQPVYDKALRVRRLIVQAFNEIFKDCDGVIIPACSKTSYTAEDATIENVFCENVFTAPASISGLPTVVTCGVQIVGKAFSDGSLLTLAEKAEKEGK